MAYSITPLLWKREEYFLLKFYSDVTFGSNWRDKRKPANQFCFYIIRDSFCHKLAVYAET